MATRKDDHCGACVKRRKPAPFQIPRSVIIRGKRWRILRDDDPKRPRSRVGYKRTPRGFDGIAYLDAREIHLREYLSPQDACLTLLHEVLHACSRQKVSKRVEERFITDVEQPMLDVLRRLRWRR